jgi:hypothetical protein
MKISLALGKGGPLSRQSAWGCLTANLALPGSGSLLAGRRTGYVQLGLAVISLAGSLIFAVRFFLWYMQHKSQMTAREDDPFGALEQMWVYLKWPLLSIGVFAFSWIWGLLTGLGLLWQAEDKTPPKLG